MTTHICVLGIDGSGKSTLTDLLPAAMAAQCYGRVAVAGKTFRVVDADRDLLQPRFAPLGLPMWARLSLALRVLCTRVVDLPRIYAVVKLLQMLAQDRAVAAITLRYQPDVMIMDGHTLLCTAGRAANYLWPARSDEEPTGAGGAVVWLLRLWLTGQMEGPVSAIRHMRLATVLVKVLRATGVHRLIPDVVVFLDASAPVALERAAARGQRLDLHENERDMDQATRMYDAALGALRVLAPNMKMVRLAVDRQDAAQTLQHCVQQAGAATLHRLPPAATEAPGGAAPTRMGAWATLKIIVSWRYLYGVLIRHLFAGAWREPLLAFTRPGRQLLVEGYSARMMRCIYRLKGTSLGERLFLGHALHAAVRERLPHAVAQIRAGVEQALKRESGTVRILTVPSGFAEDVRGAVDGILARDGALAERLEVVAVDMDPHGEVEPALRAWSHATGVALRVVKGDMTSESVRAQACPSAAGALVHVAVVVGISSWLPKPAMLSTLRWVREALDPRGVLVTDCFRADAYALSGQCLGYRASYYTPRTYAGVLALAGFSPHPKTVGAGRAGVNHVLTTFPAQPSSHWDSQHPASLVA